MPDLTPYFLGFAVVALAVAWIPLFLKRSLISWPMIAVAIGFGLFAVVLPETKILDFSRAALVMTEIALVVAVMGAGLRIDRAFRLKAWGSTWRLLAVVMPLTIGVIALAGHLLLALPLGAAILIAGILAPTDPVLAADVQVGEPGKGEEGEVRFALTSEAGLNDGLALPVVTLGLLLSAQGGESEWLGRWLILDIGLKTVAAIVIGAGLGWALVKINDRLPEHLRLSRSGDGLVLVAVTFIIYGVAQAVHAYGFVAVFTGAVTIRNASPHVDLHRRLNDFADQIERFSTAVVLLFFGGTLAAGALTNLTWPGIALAFVVLFLARPLAVAAGFWGSPLPTREKVAFGYFGIRGLGALFYVAYAQVHGAPLIPTIWPVVALVVLVSTVLFGVTTGLVMKALKLEGA